MRESKIQYNPLLSVAQNAKRNNVTEAAIRYYIKVNNIDRRFDRTQNLIADCRKYLKKHPNATKAELHEKTGHSLSTIRIYWEHITTEKELTNFDSQKKQKRQLRQLNNFYATHPSCTADILREEEFYKDVLEPFCGVGSMSEVIKQHGHNVLSYDIVDRGYGLVGDFYQVDFPRRKYDIITNPPYDNIIDVVLRCLDICKEKVAVLMPLRYLSSGSRYNELYKKCPPKRVYVYQERICIAKNADFEKYNDAGANMEIYAWYIWERGFKGATELKWISNQRTVGKKKVAVSVKVKSNKTVEYKPSQCDRALVLDFDMTLFNTATDREARLNKDWKAVYNEIPNYTLYGGWREVFKYAQESGGKIIMIRQTKGKSIKRALKHYDLHCDVVIGGGVGGHPKKTSKNSGKLIDIALQVIGCQDMPKSRIISIGDSVTDKNMSDNAGVKFYGAIWDCEKDESYAELSKGDTIQSPLEVISLLEAISIEEPSETKPVEVVEKKPTKKKQAKEAKADKKPKKINTTIRCTDTHVYFYQNTPLSNWWVSEPAIPYDNHTFTSTESLFMYLKAKVFRDDVMAERIANAHYDDAKKLGRLIQNFSDEVWERERENAMYIAIKAKLAVDEVFRDTLLSEEYKGKIFVEASPTDKVWGIRRSISDAYQGKEWRGLNLLGKLLTELRDETLGLIEPKEREITPINPDEIKTIEPVKAVPSKNTYSTDGVIVRSILGGIIGDIAGSSREGYSKNVLSPRKILTAQSYFTDDSILTVAVADWLNNQDKTTLKDCLIKWHNRYPHAGFGKLFAKFVETGEAQESNGNGGAMRVAPCGVLAKTIDEAVSLAEQQCIVSHTTDIAVNGAKAIATAVFIAKDGASKGKTDVEIKQEVKSYVEEHFGYNLNMTLEEIQAQSVELAKQREAFRRDGIESPSYLNMSNAFLSCPMAITAFLLGKNYEEAIRYALAMMGDADTIACMAGCISAQVYGIPQQLIEDALVYLPIEMIDVLNEFEPENNFEPSGITPPVISKWTEKAETVVYGSGDEQNENGGTETIASRFNPHPRFGYAIPTIGKSIEEIQDGVNAFIEHAKNNPDMRFHVRKVGYDKAGYTVEQIAPLFSEARTVRNILLPKAIVDVLNQ